MLAASVTYLSSLSAILKKCSQHTIKCKAYLSVSPNAEGRVEDVVYLNVSQLVFEWLDECECLLNYCNNLYLKDGK
jgi:hypothetical protein